MECEENHLMNMPNANAGHVFCILGLVKINHKYGIDDITKYKSVD